MIVRGKYIPTLISWLRHIVKITAFRSYRCLLSVLLRLIKHCQSVVNGKEEGFRERPGGVAVSSQPATNRPDPAPPVTPSPAAPPLGVPLQTQGSQPGTNVPNIHPGFHGRSNDAAFDADFPPNPVPLVPSPTPELSISEVDVATPPPLAVPDQIVDIILTPIVPDQVNRYQRNVRVKDKYEAFLVTKGPLDCSEELAAVEGWEPLTHPEGALIFYHPYKRVFTDADARDPETALKLDRAVEKAKEEAGNAEITLDPYVELALELITKDGKWTWGYYFVDHIKRVIFWFEDHRSDPLMNNVRGVERKSHVKHALESQYWSHIGLFPNKRFLPEDVVVELKGLVMHAHAANIIFETSLAPLAADEVTSMLGLMDPLMSSTKMEPSVWIAARFMRFFCDARFANFCGQSGARLDVDQSLYEKPDATLKSTIFFLLDFILFASAGVQRGSFHKILVDEKIVVPRWKKFMDGLNSEWRTYTIFSTVILAVNISLLAVPSVQDQYVVISLSHMSTSFAIGSLTVTLFFIWAANGRMQDSRDSRVITTDILVKMSRSVIGLESLAILFSLPFASLFWGVFLFILAFFSATFYTSTFWLSYPIYIVICSIIVWPLSYRCGTFTRSLVWTIQHPLRRRHRNIGQVLPAVPTTQPV